jgi:hypothetical protein
MKVCANPHLCFDILLVRLALQIDIKVWTKMAHSFGMFPIPHLRIGM